MWDWHWPTEEEWFRFLVLILLYGIWRSIQAGVEEIVKLRAQVQEIDANVEEIYKDALDKRFARKFGDDAEDLEQFGPVPSERKK